MEESKMKGGMFKMFENAVTEASKAVTGAVTGAATEASKAVTGAATEASKAVTGAATGASKLATTAVTGAVTGAATASSLVSSAQTAPNPTTLSAADKEAVDRHDELMKVMAEESKAKAVAKREAEAKAATEKVAAEAAAEKAATDAKALKAAAEKAATEKAAAEKAAADAKALKAASDAKAASTPTTLKVVTPANQAAAEAERLKTEEAETKAREAERLTAEKASTEAAAEAERLKTEEAETKAREAAAAEAERLKTEAAAEAERLKIEAATREAEEKAATEAERLKTEEAERLKTEAAAVRESEEEYNKATKLKETALTIPTVKIKYDEILAEIKEAKANAEKESQRKTTSERVSSEHAAEDKLKNAEPGEKQQLQTELDALYVNSSKELITEAVIQLNMLIKINPSDETRIEEQKLIIQQAEARFTKRKMDDFIKLGQVGDDAKPISNEAEAFIKYADEKLKVLSKAIQAAKQSANASQVQTEVKTEGQSPIQSASQVKTEVQTEVKIKDPDPSQVQTEGQNPKKSASPIVVSPESKDQMNARLNYLRTISISSDDTATKITEISTDISEIIKKIDKEELKAYHVTDGLKYVFPLIYNEFEKIKKGEVNQLKKYVEKINTNLSENIIKHAKIQYVRTTIKDTQEWNSRKENLGTVLIKQPYTDSYSALKGEDEMIQETPKDLLTKESIAYIILAIQGCIDGLIDIKTPDGIDESAKQAAKQEHEKDLITAKSLLQKFEKLAQELETQGTREETPTNKAKVKPNPLEDQKIKDLKALIKPQSVLNIEMCEHLFNNKHSDDATQASFNEMCKDFVLVDMMYNDIDIYKKKTFDLIKKHLFIFYPKFILLYHLSQ